MASVATSHTLLSCRKRRFDETETLMFERVWEDQISIHPQAEPEFETLPPVAMLTERENWSVDMSGIELPHDIEFYIGRDIAPLPLVSDREGYFGNRNYEYWLSGLQNYFITKQICRRHHVALDAYLEIGSASGRCMRHFAFDREFHDLWAFDLNYRHIAWINRYLPGNIRAVQNSSIPVLPVEPNSIDCVAAWSVFTHIEVFDLAWIAELRRVLRPGGVALVTVVTEHQLRRMTPDWPMHGPITTHPAWNEEFIETLERVGKRTMRWHGDRSYSSNVIYSERYLRETWSRFFEVAEWHREFPLYQDLVVLKKPR